MPVSPPSVTPYPTTTGKVQNVIDDALMEIGALAQGETANPNDSSFVMRKLNRLLDQWASRGLYVFNNEFTVYSLHAGLSPHTIGPSGTFVVPQRPVKVLSASIIQPSTPDVDAPNLNIRDDDWWAQNQTKGLQSTYPTDLYYSPAWPNGQLFFWPVPNTNYEVRLQTWGLMGQFTALTQIFSAPPGYLDAIVYSLAEVLCPAFGKDLSPALAKAAKDARTAIQQDNEASPRIATADWGMPRSGKGRNADFNYLTGQVL